MRLPDFILANVEPILAEWESFARSVTPGVNMDPAALRNHAEHILRATARDMVSSQTGQQRSDKSKGHSDISTQSSESRQLDSASDEHAIARVVSGFNMTEVVSEYRALRASVICLWRKSRPNPDCHDVDDITRFNESIDQSLTKAIHSFTKSLDESRELFLAILGHDLRSPLAAIRLTAFAMQRSGELNANHSEMAGLIANTAAVTAKVITDLLEFAVSRLGRPIVVNPATMDLKAGVEEVVKEARAAFPKCTFHLSTSGNLSGKWDASRLWQVLSNLLNNAAKHGAGRVDLSLQDNGPEVIIRVHNQGEPIPPEVQRTLFDPMARRLSPGDEVRRQNGSFGLGLYIAKEIAEAHRGTIEAASSAEAGTTFTLRLPR